MRKSALDYLAQIRIVMSKEHLSWVSTQVYDLHAGTAFPWACADKFCVCYFSPWLSVAWFQQVLPNEGVVFTSWKNLQHTPVPFCYYSLSVFFNILTSFTLLYVPTPPTPVGRWGGRDKGIVSFAIFRHSEHKQTRQNCTSTAAIAMIIITCKKCLYNSRPFWLNFCCKLKQCMHIIIMCFCQSRWTVLAFASGASMQSCRKFSSFVVWQFCTSGILYKPLDICSRSLLDM